jgi:hypothetical protein
MGFNSGDQQPLFDVSRLSAALTHNTNGFVVDEIIWDACQGMRWDQICAG